MRVVVCGGGVIGACTAYFLACRGIDVTVVECTEVAAAASGKAGGFLARDWCGGSPLDVLARRSFDLHAALVQEIGTDWGYQRMTAYAGYLVPERGARARLDWLSDGVVITQRIGTEETTAIVNPRTFTAAVMRAAQDRGAALHHARVIGLVRDADGAVTGVASNDGVIAADAVVVALGPWSLLAAGWMDLPPVFGRRSPSLVYDTASDVPAHALFLEYQDAGEALTIEVFPRGDGTTHLTAFGGEASLPLDPAAVTAQPAEIERLQAICERLSPAFRAERIVARQACFRPITQDGLPLIGKVGEGAYVATGHSVWGILNAPATGEALAELIADGAARHVNLAPFDPGRLSPLDPKLLSSE
jgi:glycine/D-amino acid oxidase-like deaminating enzyme